LSKIFFSSPFADEGGGTGFLNVGTGGFRTWLTLKDLN
jgi:hypothetical protein